jgi:protein TonB
MFKQRPLLLEEVHSPPKVRRQIVLPPPRMEPLQDVFAEAIIEETSIHQRRNPLDWAVSLAVHTAVLVALLILPLYFTNVLDVQKFNLTFLVAPLPPPAPPPPPMVSRVAPRVVPTPTRTYTPGKLTAPSFIPKVIAKIPADEEAVTGVPGGVTGGMPGGQMGGVLGGVLGGDLNRAPSLPVAAGPKKPVVVGGDVKPPRLIFAPDPEYPVLALQSRISGIVVIEAIIDEHGNVVEVRAVSGQPLLIPAALKAVSKRRYEPTILDGEATPIDLRVEIKFHAG